ncbi:hypothetical protein EVJ58_g4449 [Rhodofomes roseus]|uniref:BRCA2 OB1 domain-containing protein n=1 Tax=Rhodofomes roseus TaxID=34475 RepID=A0A4Y9YIP0_9APHY|nr:hypothetical protein EVJ58_g4449 [Rhodofomes roseus]
MSQQELEAFDEFESSQYAGRRPSPVPQDPIEVKRRRNKEIADSLDEWETQSRKKRISLERQASLDDALAPPPPPDERSQVDGVGAADFPRFSGFVSASRVAATDSGDDTHEDLAQTTHTPAKYHGFGFTSAANIDNNSFDHDTDKQPTSSPDVPEDQDYADWFSAKIPEGAATGFQPARAIKPPRPVDDPPVLLDPALNALPSFTSCRIIFNEERGPPMSQVNAEAPTISGFNSAANYVHSMQSGTVLQDWAKPSAEALARAAAKLKTWEAEMGSDFTSDPSIPEPPEGGGTLEGGGFGRPALRVLENSFAPASGAPDSPTPAGSGFGRASNLSSKLPALGRNKGFKSPLLTRPVATPRTAAGTSYVNSPLNPNTIASTSKLPPAFATPTRPGTSSFMPLVPRTTTPSKSLGLTPRRLGFSSAAGKPQFVTPFKAGMKPGESGRLDLEQKMSEASQKTSVTVIGNAKPARHIDKAPRKATFFDLTKSESRQTLESSGLRPQMYDEVELSHMVGNNYDSLKQLTPDNALFYRFNSRSSHNASSLLGESLILGADAALEDLRDTGCDLATQEWVNNHWSLILWKLAGMVCLQPQLEANPATRRWCWKEVVNQLLYRYERELNSSSRPPLRLITTHDAPATCPMILCVTNITWHNGPRDEHGSTSDRWANVEVTDGWYRIRVAVDDPIERAINSGHIRVGRKLAIQNARLMHKEGREPAEPLEAYTQMNLQICGNSCHLAPWHAKLGFMHHPMVATLDRLTADGGLVTLLDVTVERVYPIAYTEFNTTRDGMKECLGILNEKEELEAQDRWRAQREAAAQKIRDEYDVKIYRWQGWAETFEARSGSGWQPTDANDHLSADAEDQWLTLVDEPATFAQVKKELTTDRAGWLAFHARHAIAKAREDLSEDIGKELEADYPPRDSRSFRVIVVKDARWSKREPLRTGQLHIWDILNYVQTEGGKPGQFTEGERYIVSSVMPSHKTAWMEPDTGAMVYFNTTKSTRFQRVKP